MIRRLIPAAILVVALAAPAQTATIPATQTAARRNVIIFVADGLRRGSINPTDMPAFTRVRTSGVDFPNSHSVYPSVTTANASAIATGHGLGDTGDFSNSLYSGVWLTKPDPAATAGTLLAFIENDEYLANLNAVFDGNYIGEKPLLSVAADHGYNVASIGKIGPTAIQQMDALGYDELGALTTNGRIVIDDSTGSAAGFRLPQSTLDAIAAAHLPLQSPLRSNGFAPDSQWNNGFSGGPQLPGTLDANHVQEQWFADVATQVVLPNFAADSKPFVLLFWSRDPDGSQHNQGDSLQNLSPGINGPTSILGVQNADHMLAQLLAFLDSHPALKANTDVFLTSDHGFATISRREIAADGSTTAEVSANLTYADTCTEIRHDATCEKPNTLPEGMVAVDLAVRGHLRLYDAGTRATVGASAYKELQLSGEISEHPTSGGLLGDTVARADARDAQLIVAVNGGSDLIYAPTHDTAAVRAAISVLTNLDYIGGVFADDQYCPSLVDCPGALPMSAVGLVGSARTPRPAIVVSFKTFLQHPGDLQSAAVLADGSLEEGQGNHGALSRDQTLNSMAAMGPDFKRGFSDAAPIGNIDIAPTLAHILGFDLPSTGKLTGRVITEALAAGPAAPAVKPQILISAPTSAGVRTILHYQELNGVRYYDRACMVKDPKLTACP
jgi:arylsulfatase A-like enzyme